MQETKLAVLTLSTYEALIPMTFLDPLHTVGIQQDTYFKKQEQFHVHFNHIVTHQEVPMVIQAITDLFRLHNISLTPLSNNPSLFYGEVLTRANSTLLLYHHCIIPFSHSSSLNYLAAHLALLDMYTQTGAVLPLNLKFLLHITGEHDTSSLPQLSAEECNRLQADGCLWAEPGTMNLLKERTVPLLALGTKGRLHVEMKIQSTSRDISSSSSAIVPDANWRLLWALNSLKDVHEEILIEGFYDTLQPIGDDEIGHLTNLPDTAETLARQWGLDQLLLGLRGFTMHYAHLLIPTCTINFIAGGNETGPSSSSTLATHARAQVDFHLVPEQTPADILNKLQHHLQRQGFSDIEVHPLLSRAPVHTPLTDPFVQLVLRATEQAYKHSPQIIPLTPESFALSFLRQHSPMPIVVLTTSTTQTDTSPPEYPLHRHVFLAALQQILLIIEGLSKRTFYL
jgi:acetylornithine deacetylase/succinyl-diaminopimelate desuccinylase-like protein